MWDILDKYGQSERPASKKDLQELDCARFIACFRSFFYEDLLSEVYDPNGNTETIMAKAKELLELWQERGLSETDHDHVFAKALVAAIEDEDYEDPFTSPHLKPYIAERTAATEEEREIVLRVIHDRRSVRAFHDKDIPDDILARILATGQYAAHCKNLQSIRYILVNETHEPWVFRGIDIPPGRHHIAVLQDDRCYLDGAEKSRMDRIIDSGAATECMLLAIHAYGADGAWLTYNDEEQFPRLREKFGLPDYMRIVDLIEFGYGCQTPFPPQRPEASDRIIVRV